MIMAVMMIIFNGCADETSTKERTEAPRTVGAETIRSAYEGEGFDTPEEAVLYFLGGLKNLDYEQMLDAYAWETMISHYSMEEKFRQDRTFTPGDIWLPGSDDFTHALNLAALRDGEAESIARGMQAFLLDDNQIYPERADWKSEEAVIRNYLNRYTVSRLEQLRNMGNICFLTTEDVTGKDYSTGRKLESIERRRLQSGADELVAVSTVADIGDEKLFIAPTVARYGKRWYLFSMESWVMGDIVTKNNLPSLGICCFSELPFSMEHATPAGEQVPQKALLPEIRYEGDGFNTPEEAVTCYLEGLKNLDINQMLSAFAWETQAAHYDLIADYMDIPPFNSRSAMIPQIHDMAVQIDLHLMRSHQIRMIYDSFTRYLIPDYYPVSDGFSMGRITKDEDIETFLQQFNEGKLERFKGLNNIRFVTPSEYLDEHYTEDFLSEWQTRYHPRFGADEVREIVAFADMGDEHLCVAPVVARYGDRWYLVNLHSMSRDMLAKGGNSTYSAITYGFTYGPDCQPELNRK